MPRPKTRREPTNLRRLLHERDMTQAQLARLLCVTRQAVDYWCRSGVPMDRLWSVGKVLNVPLATLAPRLWREIDDRR